MKQRIRKITTILWSVVLAMMLFFNIRMDVEAEGEVNYTVEATTYDIAESKLKFTISSDSNESYIAYYLDESLESTLTKEQMFEAAVKTTSTSIEVFVLNADIYLWEISSGGDVLYGVDSAQSLELLGYTYLQADTENKIEYINGDNLEDYDPQFTVTSGIPSFNLTGVPKGTYIPVSMYCKEDLNHDIHSSIYYVFYQKEGIDSIPGFAAYINETGSYIFTMFVKEDGGSVHSRHYRATYNYTKPEDKMSTVSNLKWNEEQIGVGSFEPLAEDCAYVRYLEGCTAGGEFETLWTTHYTKGYDDYQIDYSDYMEDENMAYRVGVRTVSNDIEAIANSDIIYTEIYDPHGILQDTTPSLEGVSEEVVAFVERMYSVVLDREPEADGLSYWAHALTNYEIDGAGLSRGFVLSDEFVEKGLSDEEYLNVMYRTFFDREGDADGTAYWVNALASGTSRVQVLAGFINSQEFSDVCDRYKIARGTMQADGTVQYNKGVREFVLRMYEKVLERDGETMGVEYWTNAILQGQATPVAVAKEYFYSEEYLDKNTTNEEYVETLYQAFMDRESEATGKAYWVGELNSGMDRAVALEGFAYSEEFKEIMSRYGL